MSLRPCLPPKGGINERRCKREAILKGATAFCVDMIGKGHRCFLSSEKLGRTEMGFGQP